MTRLQAEAPALAAELGAIEASRRRDTVLRACEMALAASGVREQLVYDTLVELSNKGSLSNQTRADLQALADRLDNSYFDLHEVEEQKGEGTAESHRFFTQARAVSALLCAGEGDTPDQVAEALYEAAHAMPEPELLYAVLLNQLRGTGDSNQWGG